MGKIGGNIDLILKVEGSYKKNKIGENTPVLVDYFTLHGFLDMASTNTTHSTYNAKIQDSTHYFICDYVELPTFKDSNGLERKPMIDELKAVCNGKEYDVLWIDDPMELHKHLEIYLEYIGV